MKFQHLDGALGINPSQLLDIASEIYYGWETKILKQSIIFLETVQGNQKERQDLKGKGNDPLGTNQ